MSLLSPSAITALKKAGVWEIIFPTSPPASLPIHLQISYSSKDTISFGNLIAKEDAQVRPKVEFFPGEEGGSYCLIMIDPDAPSVSNPVNRSFLHWIVPNITPPSISTLEALAVKVKDTLTEEENTITPLPEDHALYMGPGPPKGSGLHRYLFLLFKQLTPNLKFDDSVPIAKEYPPRRHFEVEPFCKKWGLEPVGAQYMIVESEPADA